MSPIDCERALAQISLYLDGELVGEASIEMTQHVEGCSPCHERAEFQRHVKEIVRGACGQCEIPPGLLERLRAFLDAVDR